MSKTSKSFKEVEKSLAKLAKSAKEELPAELREGWNSAISGVNAEAIGNAGASLIEGVTGKSKAAKRTRSSVQSAVKNAQKSLAPKKSHKFRNFVIFSLIAAAVAAAVAKKKSA
ncbi:hypothetical protein AUR04nite_01130 [Glutamicibacter uratoxydans]|uniref:Uncharacterized protein n=1 Tax=Glutamicibacter uratoxydans TaxID=43667 RepID=A0A4Y4DPT4_GLUUR|nr:hypothetical protein [Glutamicibacter uratoxydans]GED04581.1 hypothetical protein AUR04nite_01130 [Glutamicibacter uratoxydans]